jgi:ADP-heptose:LPS heptosyltransferase
LEGHPALDELIRVPRRWLKSPRAVWQLRQRLRAARYDTAIDVQGLSKSSIVSWLSGAPRRIGPGGRDGREVSPLLNNERVVPSATHVIDRNLQLLRPLGIDQCDVRFDLPEAADDARRVEAFLRDAGLTGGFAVINPGAGWPSKLWCPERFGEVATHLGRRFGLPSVAVWAGDDEHQWAQSIVARSDGWARLAPPTTLCELAALLRRGRLMVASDTGPLHIAAAVGTPCVGLFGPMPHERNGPYGPQHIAVQVERLTGRSRHLRRADNASMLAIGAELVCHACDTILARGAEKPHSQVA